MTDLVATFNSLGIKVSVYKNRLVHEMPGCLFSKKETILFRNIASIEKPALLNCIDIKTNDGKVHRLALMNPAETEKMKTQIEALL